MHGMKGPTPELTLEAGVAAVLMVGWPAATAAGGESSYQEAVERQTADLQSKQSHKKPTRK